MAQAAERRNPRQALLDAAERLLIEVGYAGITTRRLAAIAGVNHGLVHYYFGSMENVLASTLERFTDRLLERQRAMYEADVPFIERWRTAMGYLETDQDSGYQKVWLELMALAWNRAELRERLAAVTREWHELLIDVFEHPVHSALVVRAAIARSHARSTLRGKGQAGSGKSPL